MNKQETLKVTFGPLMLWKGVLEFLSSLDKETWNEWYRFGHNRQEVTENLTKEIKRIYFTAGIVREKGKRKIVSIGHIESTTGKQCRIGLVVSPTVRKLGIGTAHAKFLVSEATKRKFNDIRLSANLENKPAIALWEKVGFETLYVFKDNPNRVEMKYETKRNTPSSNISLESIPLPEKQQVKKEPINSVSVEMPTTWTMPRRKESYKILLHAPLHLSYWIYLMELFPKWEFYITPEADFEEASIPQEHINYTVIKDTKGMDFDAQIINLAVYHGIKKRSDLYELLDKHPYPPVFLEFGRNHIPEVKGLKFPVISGSRTFSSSKYPNIRYMYVPPSATLWNKDWIGDKKEIFMPVQGHMLPQNKGSGVKDMVETLKSAGIPLKLVENKVRSEPFEDWRNHYIHSRGLFEFTLKYASFITEEALMIGTPIVVKANFDSKLMIRNCKDGFSNISTQKTIEVLQRLVDDYEFAKEWSKKAKERGKTLLQPEITIGVVEEAVRDAIRLYKTKPNL